MATTTTTYRDCIVERTQLSIYVGAVGMGVASKGIRIGNHRALYHVVLSSVGGPVVGEGVVENLDSGHMSSRRW